jgi:hypothetical protein
VSLDILSDLNIFDKVPLSDQSSQILATLLGPSWAQGGWGEGAASTLLEALMSGFNYLALGLVSILFIYFILQGAAGAACEGLALGRRFSSLWMPLRFAFSIGFLAPVVKGFSIFQVLILFFVGLSVNMANFVWDKGLGYFVESSAKLSFNPPEALVDDSKQLGAGLLKALTIQEYFRQRLDMDISGPLASEVYYPPTGEVGGLLVLTMSVPSGSNLAPGDLGRLRLPCLEPNLKLCQARLSAVRGFISDLRPLATALADPVREIDNSLSGALARACANYQLETAPWLTAQSGEKRLELERDLREFKEAAKINGWAAAGAYYWTIARLNEKAASLYYDSALFSGGEGPSQSEALEDFEPIFERLNRYLKGAYRPERSSMAESLGGEFPSLEWFSDRLKGYLGRKALSSLVENLEKSDPIAVLASLGRFMVASSQAVIGLKVASNALAVGSAHSASSVLGQFVSIFTGSVSSFLAGSIVGTVEALGPYLLTVSFILGGYGFFLAYFLPALPFLIWLSAVLSWAISVVEAIAAAPLWVAAHALPEGEGLAGRAGARG